MREFVADVGNSRMKWGECQRNGIGSYVTVVLNDPKSWTTQFDQLDHGARSNWTLAGSNPDALHVFGDWLRQRGQAVRVIDSFRQLPIVVRVDRPESVGIDRLLNGVAVLKRKIPAIVIDAGSAVTVDLVDADGVFCGGAIFPGLLLMAKALNDYTARLPLIDHIFTTDLPLPATNTVAAIEAGIGNAVAGGIDRIVRELCSRSAATSIYLTGGDAERLIGLDCCPEIAPALTLEGICIASRRLS
jgi:type III pantothenate kinase